MDLGINRDLFRVVGCARGSACAHGEDLLGGDGVQIVHSNRRGVRDIEDIGSAHTEAEVELLKAAARQPLAAGQGVLDLGLQVLAGGGGGTSVPAGSPLPIRSSRMAHLGNALAGVYERLGFNEAAGGDEVFRQLVLAQIIEPSSKVDGSSNLTGQRGFPG